MVQWKKCISQNIGVARINDLNDYISYRPIDDISPIDQFYSEMKSILALFPMTAWNQNKWTGALASIAIISSVENYFRQIFSYMLKICTDAQKSASTQVISLGSVIWHPSNEIERGAFEHISLASSDNICSSAKKFLNLDLSKKLKDIFVEFDKVCELRHGIVHSANILAGKNGIKLNLPTRNDITVINIEYDQFQELMAICNALIVASNQIIFEELCFRWATTWRKAPSWNIQQESKKFKEIWGVCYSKRDEENNTIPEVLKWHQCKSKVKNEYNI